MRTVAKGVAASLIGAAIAVVGWALLFMRLTIVPGEAAYPADWASLSQTARNDWLLSHTVTLSGFDAIAHALEHGSVFGPEVLSLFGLSFFAAFIALAVHRALRGHAP